MKRIRILSLVAAIALLVPLAAEAQTAGTITFGVEVTTAANGTVTPKATWSTSPAATSCSASSGWTGAKAASGSETLSAVSKSTVYRIDCTWADNQARLTWTPPTTTTDGSALTDLAGYRIYFGTSASALSQVQTVANAGATAATVSPLAAGTWYFALEAYTSAGAESLPSTVVSKITGSASGTKSVTLAVNIPNAPTNVTAQ